MNYDIHFHLNSNSKLHNRMYFLSKWGLIFILHVDFIVFELNSSQDFNSGGGVVPNSE
jgi:hypothetical protein